MRVPFSVANNWAALPEIQRPVPWTTGSGKVGICFCADVDGATWKIRLNDFPDEPLYTLILGDQEVIHFDDWPSFWTRPALPKMDWSPE